MAEGDVAVILIQDGILELVSDRLQRTFYKGKNSMVEFFSLMDQVEGKEKCDLTERINMVLDEMEDLERKGMRSNIERNRGFPPTI